MDDTLSKKTNEQKIRHAIRNDIQIALCNCMMLDLAVASNDLESIRRISQDLKKSMIHIVEACQSESPQTPQANSEPATLRFSA